MIIFLLAWRLSAAIQLYLQTYARTNIAIAGLRTRRDLGGPSRKRSSPPRRTPGPAPSFLDVIDRGGPP